MCSDEYEDFPAGQEDTKEACQEYLDQTAACRGLGWTAEAVRRDRSNKSPALEEKSQHVNQEGRKNQESERHK